MNKIYIKPVIKVYDAHCNTILAGTLEVKKGTTGEQNAKSGNLDFEFEDED